MYCIKNARISIAGKIVENGTISFDDRIQKIGEAVGDEIVIPKDAVVVPGFIDQHVHGAGGAEVGDCSISALKQVSQTLSKGGVTSFLATTVTQKEERLIEACCCVAEYMKKHNDIGAEILGMHLEGPFLSKKYKGAMKEECILSPEMKTFNKFYKASNGTIKMITLAPEKEGALDFIKDLTAKGVVVSLGHTAATYDIVQKAFECGAKCITHTYNAQSPLHHREIGVVGSALLMDDLYCEIIGDTVHVSVPAIKVLVKNKPKDKVVLITDALRSQGLPEGLSDTGGLPIKIEKDCARLLDGTLAGTVVPMNGMIRNLVEKVGVPFETAIDFATINPAKNLGVEKNKGSIELGKDADFTILDSNFEVYMTIRGGKIVYDSKRGIKQ